jgi:hypothetical protein
MGGVCVATNWIGRRGLAAAVIVLAPALAGCSSMPSVPSVPSFSSLFGSAAADSNASAYTPPADFECPSVTIRQGASTLAVSNNPSDQSPLNLRYQVGFGETARECRVTGAIVTMKVGIQGRVILGPAGGPGQIDVPLRLAVIHEGVDPKTIVTKLERLSVTVSPDDRNVMFTHVDEMSFPMPRGNEIDSYVVYIGFDPIGARELDRKKPAPRPARPPRRQS